MYDPLPIEIANWAIYGRFQPVVDENYRLPNRTRILLEYDDTGAFIERDHVTGAIIDVGVLEGFLRPDKRDAA